MNNIRGIIIQSRVDYLEKFWGRSKSREIFSALSEQSRTAIGEQIFLTTLYPFRMLKELDFAIKSHLDKSKAEVHKEIGNYFADQIVSTYFFNYLESKNPSRFLFQVDNLYDYLWKFGKYSLKQISDNSAEVNFEFDEEVHPAYCLFLKEFLLKGLQLCGAEKIECSHTNCGMIDCDSCNFELNWN